MCMHQYSFLKLLYVYGAVKAVSVNIVSDGEISFK